MPTTKTKPKRTGLQLQIAVTIQLPKGIAPPSGDLIREAWDRKVRDDEDTPGISFQIVEWRHGSNAPTSGDPDEAWQKFRRVLPSCTVSFSQVRQAESARE